jgi:hypothetical protein
VAWRGTDNRLNIESSPDGVNFDPNTKRTIPGETTSAAPALAVFFQNQKTEPLLAIAWTGTDPQHHLNVEWSPDGLTFIQSTKRTFGATTLASDGPALAPFGDNSGGAGNGLAIAWTGTDNQLNVAYSFDGEQFDIASPLGQTSPYGPTLAEDSVGGDEIGWTGTDHLHQLNIGYLQSWSAVLGGSEISGGAITLGPSYTSNNAPSLTYHGDTLEFAWTGTDNRLNLGSLAGDITTLSDTSPYGPSVVAGSVEGDTHRYQLWRAWTGTDGRPNVVGSQPLGVLGPVSTGFPSDGGFTSPQGPSPAAGSVEGDPQEYQLWQARTGTDGLEFTALGRGVRSLRHVRGIV